ncbi:hypothetical protein DAPPUDRAFT_258523 [Daphnia pulex]|uniref:Uncharacterized protein n=1 Tax=Daphnia pulex TaxID=6669 RepID=E9HFJ5_DAPPU|nr:hypothetical protein DAPPUDRAFT_258523 [Daphnia pulex]|eukprot:EFX69443.1 hypothetical protein DAPPUDRAFT_258523 [Daphnia pulex]
MAEHAVPDNSMRAVSHVPKFDGTNHREWNYEIDLCFQNLDIADVVLGLELCPDEDYDDDGDIANETEIRQ